MKPQVCILKTDGINCDNETAYAFKKLGADVEVLLFNQLKKNKDQLKKYQILVIPGGFSYGDDISSGKIFALELMTFLKNEIYEFMADKKLILGICNGFQVLVKSGILPFQSNIQDVTLTHNSSSKFECRWTSMLVEKTNCIFTKGLEGVDITLPVANGEGKFFASNQLIKQVEENNLVVLRYSKNGIATQSYPENPSNSLNAIAGICDSSGQIFGLMPHPERFVDKLQHPLWRTKSSEPIGLRILENGINYARQNL